jgi:hypothetical protein
MTAFRVVPVKFEHACSYVRDVHRHHQPPRGHKFSLGAVAGEVLVGVAIVGRPVSRRFDDGRTLEVTRCASEGDQNVCSFLYAACRRATFALGYDRLVTYTQAGESGASLRAAGWRVVASRPAHPGWSRRLRPRRALGTEFVERTLWEASCA